MIIRWIFITSCQMATYHLCGSFTKGVTADDRRFHTEDEHDNLPSVWLVYRGRYSRWRKILYRGWAWQLTICVARLQRVLQQMMEDTIQRMSMTTYHLCGSFTKGVTADDGRYYTEDGHDNLPSVWLIYRGRYSRWWKILYQITSMTTYHLCVSFT